MAQILDINGNWIDDGQPAQGLINSKKVEGQKYQVEVGQNEQGQPIYEEQAYKATAPILKESYAPGEEAQYIADLSTMTHQGIGQQAASAETGTDTWQAHSTGTEETFTPEEAIDLYNKMDPRLANDRNMSSRLTGANAYYESEGDFRPGGERATSQNFKDYITQSEIDSAKQSRNMAILGSLMVGGIAGGAVLAGGVAAGGGGAAAAGSGAAASGGAGAIGATTAAEAAAGSSALASQLSPYLAAEGAAAAGGGAAAAGGSGSGGALGASNSFLSSPTGKFLASQAVGLGSKALAGGKEKEQNPGLVNSSQNKPQQQQPTVINYYGNRPQETPQYTPKPISIANGSMYGSGSGWGSSISTY